MCGTWALQCRDYSDYPSGTLWNSYWDQNRVICIQGRSLNTCTINLLPVPTHCSQVQSFHLWCSFSQRFQMSLLILNIYYFGEHYSNLQWHLFKLSDPPFVFCLFSVVQSSPISLQLRMLKILNFRAFIQYSSFFQFHTQARCLFVYFKDAIFKFQVS